MGDPDDSEEDELILDYVYHIVTRLRLPGHKRQLPYELSGHHQVTSGCDLVIDIRTGPCGQVGCC